ncbi:phosphohistidine phosphatase [Allocatelliglobosispora scoriae]|uniref:Phosphohistidine phosphatase n=1 Tax=Allocatelliglobosispora scoriae TaxID=643052 RepID=A0A841C1W0_9ACTN|nr:histidine phosphatase family protein [Allocatelliglobosispora scoriae]MBB5873309.1 phosphohistidine phosphatase [Allocatelliglobosispora scoriae]
MTERTLIILRHAKAENPAGVADADRPLTQRGHTDAAAAGAYLSNSSLVPDLVICSPARRTRQTWHAVAMALPSAPEVVYEPSVYSGGVAEVLALVQRVVDPIATVLVIGHNPTLSQLSALLDQSGAAGELRTSGIAVHRFTGTWSELRHRSAPLTASHTGRAQL